MCESHARWPWAAGGGGVTDQERREQLRKRTFSVSGQKHPSGALAGQSGCREGGEEGAESSWRD